MGPECNRYTMASCGRLTPSTTSQLVEAVEAFLGETDAVLLDEFQRRLQPYRIMMMEVNVGEHRICKPKLLLEQDDSSRVPNDSTMSTSSGTLSNADDMASFRSFQDPQGRTADLEPVHLTSGIGVSDLGPSNVAISLSQGVIEPIRPNHDLQTECIFLDPNPWDYGLLSAIDCFNPMEPLDLPIELLRDLYHRGSSLTPGCGAETQPIVSSAAVTPEPSTAARKSGQHVGKRNSKELRHNRQRQYIRDDSITFIEKNFESWKANGIWRQTALSGPSLGHSDYETLESIYCYIRKLDRQRDQDPICRRATLVLLDLWYKQALRQWQLEEVPPHCRESISVGRGGASAMIDNILHRMHPEWNECDLFKKAELRARFHNEKRHGKRWSILIAGLGPGIIFLCSSELVRDVRDTTVALSALEQIAADCVSSSPLSIELLQVLSPLAQSLLHNEDIHAFNSEGFSDQLQRLKLAHNMAI